MQSTTSSSSSASQSTTTLLASSPTSRKNYEEGFARLSSTYGLAGFAGGEQYFRPATQTSSSRVVTTTPAVATATPASTQPAVAAKNFEAAFGQLASSYGFGGYSGSNVNARKA